MSKFQRAERKRVKLKIAITGPSGSGKTFSALELASGLGAKIALIDTENDSASLYSDRFTFDTLVIDPPYTIQKYMDSVKAAQDEQYDVVVIDSISHAWAGDGGLLSKKEAMDARGGNNFANWGTITKEQEAFKASLLNADIHMICTMRSKQEYAQVGDGGKLKVQKLGLAPIQRDGMEYEFTTVFDVAMDHNAQASKDRTGLFDGQLLRLTKETGEKLLSWLNGAKVEAPKPQPPAVQESPVQEPQASNVKALPPPRPYNNGDRTITEKQIARIHAKAKSVGMDKEEFTDFIAKHGYASSKDITMNDYNKLCEEVDAWKAPSFTAEEIPY